MLQLPLAYEDRVITAFPYRDRIMVVTEGGQVFEIRVEENEMDESVRLVSS